MSDIISGRFEVFQEPRSSENYQHRITYYVSKTVCLGMKRPCILSPYVLWLTRDLSSLLRLTGLRARSCLMFLNESCGSSQVKTHSLYAFMNVSVFFEAVCKKEPSLCPSGHNTLLTGGPEEQRGEDSRG